MIDGMEGEDEQQAEAYRQHQEEHFADQAIDHACRVFGFEQVIRKVVERWAEHMAKVQPQPESEPF